MFINKTKNYTKNIYDLIIIYFSLCIKGGSPSLLLESPIVFSKFALLALAAYSLTFVFCAIFKCLHFSATHTAYICTYARLARTPQQAVSLARLLPYVSIIGIC